MKRRTKIDKKAFIDRMPNIDQFDWLDAKLKETNIPMSILVIVTYFFINNNYYYYEMFCK